MPSVDTYIYNNDGSILYADDGYWDFGFTALITENGFNITGGMGGIDNTYEGATFENDTLTLPFKIKGFSKTPNQSNPDEGFAVGDTADFGTVLNVANNYYAVNSPVAQKKPDWANCFVKTASGNKAVEKVWIKQGSSLNVVWEKPVGPTLSGVWKRITGRNPGGSVSIVQNISFISNNISYSSYRAEGQDSDHSTKLYYDNTIVFKWEFWNGGWSRTWKTAYMTVDFGETSQSVSQEFYDYFIKYMRKQS